MAAELVLVILVLAAILFALVLLYTYFLYWNNHRNSVSDVGTRSTRYKVELDDVSQQPKVSSIDETDKNSLNNAELTIFNETKTKGVIVGKTGKTEGNQGKQLEHESIPSTVDVDPSNFATLPIHHKYPAVKSTVSVHCATKENLEKSYCDKAISTDDDGNNDTPVEVSENVKTGAVEAFEDMDLCKVLLENIKRKCSEPNRIQKYATPVLLNGQDLMLCEETGSGRMTAFFIPILQSLINEPVITTCTISNSKPIIKPQAVIITPTREAVVEFYNEAIVYTYQSKVKIGKVYGGVSIIYQKTELQSGCNILIGTPHRVLQLIDENYIDVSDVGFFILDEADRALDFGYNTDIQRIVSHLPPKGDRVSAIFSTTFPTVIRDMADEFLKNYAFLQLSVIGKSNGVNLYPRVQYS